MCEQVMILGCGGIGAWVATFIAGIQAVKYLILVDPDVIEISNLNRTPFDISTVGNLKVSALTSMLCTSNPLLTVVPLNQYFDARFAERFGIGSETYHTVHHPFLPNEDVLVIDCRDNFYNDYDLLDKIFKKEIYIIRAAYNGSSITIDFNPMDHPVMGRGGYTITPSHIIPASMAALLVLVGAINIKRYQSEPSKYRWILDNPLTFNVEDILEYIFKGVILDRMTNDGDKCAKTITDDILKQDFLNIVEKHLPVANTNENVELD